MFARLDVDVVRHAFSAVGADRSTKIKLIPVSISDRIFQLVSSAVERVAPVPVVVEESKPAEEPMRAIQLGPQVQPSIALSQDAGLARGCIDGVEPEPVRAAEVQQEPLGDRLIRGDRQPIHRIELAELPFEPPDNVSILLAERRRHATEHKCRDQPGLTRRMPQSPQGFVSHRHHAMGRLQQLDRACLPYATYSVDDLRFGSRRGGKWFSKGECAYPGVRAQLCGR